MANEIRTNRDGELVMRAVVRAQGGDTSALHFLYSRFSDDVCGYVRSFVRNPHDAEDITQNVFAKLMRIIPKYQPRQVPFSAWLLRVARNAALDHLRASRTVPCEEVRTSDEGAEEGGVERSQAIRAALSDIPTEQREVLVLRHLAGLSPPEIADRLGRSEASVHGLHHRGRRALQTALVENDAAPVTVAAG
jgi:RNA polymerase sigma-70 factor (ECF subfamily)